MLFHVRDIFIINVCQARELANVKLFGLNSGASKDVRRRKFPDESKSPQESLAWSGHDLFQDRDSLAFGRPGCGAPARTKSGRIRTTLIGSQDIRFQANEGVQKSIENNIRYTAHPSEKATYHAELEAQVRERREQEALEKQTNKEVGGWGLIFSTFFNLRSTESLVASRASNGASLGQEEPIGGLQPSPGRASLIRWSAPLSFLNSDFCSFGGFSYV